MIHLCCAFQIAELSQIDSVPIQRKWIAVSYLSHIIKIPSQ